MGMLDVAEESQLSRKGSWWAGRCAEEWANRETEGEDGEDDCVILSDKLPT